MLEIIQDSTSGEFLLKNGPRETPLTFEQIKWIYPDLYDLDFDMKLAESYYLQK